MFAKATSEVSNNQLWKNKFRLFYSNRFSDSVHYSVLLAGGWCRKLAGGQLRVNDAFYLQNFKGVKNLGYFYDPEGQKQGIKGDILGFDKYLSVLAKVAP